MYILLIRNAPFSCDDVIVIIFLFFNISSIINIKNQLIFIYFYLLKGYI